ncbi:MAG: hypothetical protein IJX02_02470 [Clostridia bacterium]|nr:hypothetical protein [Clostridia bacterium]
MDKLRRKWNKMCREFLRWIWSQCKDWKTVVLLVVVAIVMYSPAIVGWVLFFIFGWDWGWITATAYTAFWLGPFSPFFAICIAITLSIKRLMQVITRKKNKSNEAAEGEQSAIEAQPAEGEQLAIEAQETENEPTDTQTPEGEKQNDTN